MVNAKTNKTLEESHGGLMHEQIGYSWLRHVCNGVLLGHNPEETSVVVIAGKSIYLDDAGHPVDKPFLVLGGCIASEQRWIDFEKPWRSALELHKVAYPFHATDFFHENALNPKLRHVTRDLIRVISNHIDGAFSVGIDIEAYKRLNREKMLEECSGAPIAMISRVLRKNVDRTRIAFGDNAPLLYFIEKGTYQRGDLIDCWKYLDQINAPIQVDKSHPSAQVADLYAYSVYQSAPFKSPSWQHKEFVDSFRHKRIYHADSRVMESDMMAFLKKRTVHTDEVGRIRVPNRNEYTEVSFGRNKNEQQKIRRAKIGIVKDDGQTKV